MKSRHIYLNLFAIDFPITALTSIVHRLSGIFLFLSMPILLYFFYLTLESSSSFIVAKALVSRFYIKLFIYIFLYALIYHFFNGIKHMILDLGYFDSKSASRGFSVIILFVILFFIALSILL